MCSFVSRLSTTTCIGPLNSHLQNFGVDPGQMDHVNDVEGRENVERA